MRYPPRVKVHLPDGRQAFCVLRVVSPRRGIELEEIIDRGGPWLETEVFPETVQRLHPILASIETPLAFSNGDCDPVNSLSHRALRYAVYGGSRGTALWPARGSSSSVRPS
jgi:hypothetical protein